MSLLLKFFILMAFAEAPVQVTDSIDKIEVYVLKAQWAEAIAGLRNVPSSEKTKRYRQLLEKAAIGYIQSEASNLSNAEKIADELPTEFPLLKTNEGFQRERDRISQLGFSSCFNASPEHKECALRLFSRVDKDPERTEFLIWAMMQLYFRGYSDLSYKALGLGIKSKGGRSVCASASLLDISVNTLAKEPPYSDLFLNAIKERCWKEVRGKLAKEIATQKAESFIKNACDLFKEMKTPHARCAKR